MLKPLKCTLFTILFCSLISCATKPPDVPVFENMQQRLSTDPVSGHLVLTASPTCMKYIGEPECGHGVYIVSGRQIIIGELPGHLLNGKKWSELKAQSIYVPAKESYAPLSTYMINSCKKMNCDSQIDAYKVKLDSLNGISDVILKP